MLVRYFRVNADEVLMVQRRDKRQVRSSGWHVDVSARLVRLCLECKPVTVVLVQRVLTEVVDCFSQAFNCVIGPAATVGFNAFATTPKHENLCSEFGAEIHRATSFLQCV